MSIRIDHPAYKSFAIVEVKANEGKWNLPAQTVPTLELQTSSITGVRFYSDHQDLHGKETVYCLRIYQGNGNTPLPYCFLQEFSTRDLFDLSLRVGNDKFGDALVPGKDLVEAKEVLQMVSLEDLQWNGTLEDQCHPMIRWNNTLRN